MNEHLPENVPAMLMELLSFSRVNGLGKKEQSLLLQLLVLITLFSMKGQ